MMTMTNNEVKNYDDCEEYEDEPPRWVWSDELDREIDRYDDDEYGVDEVWYDPKDREWKASVYRYEPSDAELYGTGWYDCNTDWRSWR